MKRKKYLFVTYKMSDGGAERVISYISKELVKKDNEVAIFIYKRTENEYSIHPDIKVFTMENTYSEEETNFCTRIFKRIVTLRKVLKQYRPNYVIPFLDEMVYETFFAISGLNITLIATIRNKPQRGFGIRKILTNIAYERCNAIWLQTEKQKSYISKKVRNKAFVIPNPVSDELIYAAKKRKYNNSIKTVVTCGRLCTQKNHMLLIEAMCIVHKKYPKVILQIWGEGTVDYKEKLYAMISDVDAKDYIFIMGRSSKIIEVLDQADLFVLSSDYEGLPNALMEAMAAGLPCVSTDCPTGPYDLLGNNERGILVPITDAVALANGIINMCSNPERAKEYGSKAHQYIEENCTLENITNELIRNCELYER